MISLSDVINIAYKAMEHNRRIIKYNFSFIIKDNKNIKTIFDCERIHYSSGDIKYIIKTLNGTITIKVLSDKENLKYIILMQDIEEYLEKKALEDINNITFDEEIKSIDDFEDD